MKKSISLFLSLAIIISMIGVTVNALTTDKVDPLLKELINEDGGAVVEITHHNPQYPTSGVSDDVRNDNNVKATSLLCSQIEAISYCEVFRFEIDKLYIGLPYKSLEKVAQLETIDMISAYDKSAVSSKSPDKKISDTFMTFLDTADPGTKLNLKVFLSYHPAVYYGFTEDDFSNPSDFSNARQQTRFDYYTSNNQKFYDDIASKAEISLIDISNHSQVICISAKASEMKALCEAKEIDEIEPISFESPNGETQMFETETQVPTEEPTEPCEEQDSSVFLYEEKFDAFMASKNIPKYTEESTGTFGTYYDYDELYYHYRTDSDIDWALIQAHVELFVPIEDYQYLKIGSKVLRSWMPGLDIYPFGLFIYDAKEDTFYPIESADLDRYARLEEAVETLGLGYSLGDVDMDGKVSVIDATFVQKYKANLKDAFELCLGAADVDGDHVVSVMDATRIQKQLAGIES